MNVHIPVPDKRPRRKNPWKAAENAVRNSFKVLFPFIVLASVLGYLAWVLWSVDTGIWAYETVTKRQLNATHGNTQTIMILSGVALAIIAVITGIRTVTNITDWYSRKSSEWDRKQRED